MPNDVARFVGVTMEAIRMFVPASFKVRVADEAADYPLCATGMIDFHASAIDAFTPAELLIPAPLTPLCLFIALHEVGHVANGDMLKWVGTREAEKHASSWAKAWLEKHDLPVPPEVWAVAETGWTDKAPARARHGQRFLTRQRALPPFLSDI